MDCALAAVLVFASLTARADDDVATLRAEAAKVLAPLPARMPGAENDTSARVKLGRELFFDKRLSVNGNISCDSCHSLDNGGAYPRPPVHVPVKHSPRNSPTVLNAGFQFAQFWDGRSSNLEAQAKEPMLNPDEMGLPAEADLLKRLRGLKTYQTRFPEAFSDGTEPITIKNMSEAIAAFERTMITHDRFDEFLRGDDRALSRAEKTGLKIFLQTGCETCHNGPGLGGNSFQKIGVLHPYADTNDFGRARITNQESDRYQFKVSSLRNVALTAPYFHDGQIATLNDAVRQMAYLQLDIQLSPADTEFIAEFLRSLSDKGLAVRVPH